MLDLVDLSRKPLPVQPQGLQQLAALVQEQAHFLVADDSAAVRNSLSALLRDENYRVTTARDGLEAMRIMQDNRFSLVLQVPTAGPALHSPKRQACCGLLGRCARRGRGKS